jgi:hypothetical protein
MILVLKAAHTAHIAVQKADIFIYGKRNGEQHAAMAGCFKMLTGRIKGNDITQFIIRLAVKQAKNKPLNGWDKTVLRMQKYITDNANDSSKVNWANQKIREAVADSIKYRARF